MSKKRRKDYDVDEIIKKAGHGEKISEVQEALVKEAGKELPDYKEKKRRLEIESILSAEKPEFKSIGIGVHNGCLYYGFPYYDDKGKQKTAIVTSNKEVFMEEEIKEKFKLSYRFPLFADCIDNSFSNAIVSDFCYRSPKRWSLKKIFEEIVKLNKRYIHHHKPEYHDYVALDIISNWVYVIFENKGRTFINAEKRSGKTTQTYLYFYLTFNPILSPNISGASFYRIIESTGGSVLVDDFDDQEEEQKRSVIQSVRVGYKKHQKAIRSEGQNNIPKGFNLFAPVVLNNIGGIDQTTQDRCNTIRMIRSKNAKITNQKIQKDADKLAEIRDQIFLWAMNDWKKVQEEYKKFETEEIEGRDLERLEGVLVIAKIIGKKIFESQLKFWKEENAQVSMKDLSHDWRFIVFRKLNDILGGSSEEWITTKSITEEIAPIIFNPEAMDYEKNKRRLAGFVGKKLSSCPLFKRRRIGAGTEYLITRESLNYYIDVFEYPIETHTQHTQHTLHTQGTLHTQDFSVGSVCSVPIPPAETGKLKPGVFFSDNEPRSFETFEKTLLEKFGKKWKELSNDILDEWKKSGKISEIEPNSFILIGGE